KADVLSSMLSEGDRALSKHEVHDARDRADAEEPRGSRCFTCALHLGSETLECCAVAPHRVRVRSHNIWVHAQARGHGHIPSTSSVNVRPSSLFAAARRRARTSSFQSRSKRSESAPLQL